MPRNTSQLFAILNDGDVRRLPLGNSIQPNIFDLFEEQSTAVVADQVEALDFDPNLRPDEDHVIKIPNFDLPTSISGAIRNPLGVHTLNITADNLEKLRALFLGEPEPDGPIWFQTFSRKQVLAKDRLGLVLSGDTLTRLTEPGLVLDSQLAAVYQDNALYFRSYTAAKRVLDLADYYKAATDAEVDGFLLHDRLHCDDAAALKASADTWIRRRVALLSDDGTLDTLKPRFAAKIAAQFGVTITVKKVSGKERIVLPTARAELKNVLRLLGDDYYSAPLSGAKYESHSKRKLSAT